MINRAQSVVLAMLILLSIGMVLYPPFGMTNIARTHVGYAFLLDPPYSSAVVEVWRLLLQIGALWLIGGVFFLALKNNRQ